MLGMGKKRPSSTAGASGHASSGEVNSTAMHGGAMRRSVVRLSAVAAVIVVAAGGALVAATAGSSALTGAALPSSVGLSGWDTVSNSWTHGNTVQYSEKQAIPFQLDLGGLTTGTSYLVNICREFQNGTK